MRRVWPWIRYVSTAIPGPFATAVRRLRDYLGDLPIHTTCLSASEGMLGLNLEIDQPERYVLCNGCAHFEFIAHDKVHEDQPASCGIDELSRGAAYELVLTNDAGLYRYRLGDIVEVVDFHHEAPVFRFRHRMGSMLDLMGEKTSEEQALSAVQEAVGEADLVDYAAWPDSLSSPPRYMLYIEAASHCSDVESLALRLEGALCAANPAYAGYRAGGHRLAPPIVRVVRPGTFRALDARRLERSPGVGKNQLKTLRLLMDEDLRRFLDAAAIQD